MKIKISFFVLASALCLFSPYKQIAEAAEPPAMTGPDTPALRSTDEELEQRRVDALQNIQDALDEDPDEAAKILGSTPVNDLDLESLEALGDKAFQFVQQKMLEQQQEQREERQRLRDLQNIQNSRR